MYLKLIYSNFELVLRADDGVLQQGVVCLRDFRWAFSRVLSAKRQKRQHSILQILGKRPYMVMNQDSRTGTGGRLLDIG